MTDSEKADLCWDAFRYIADEMSAKEQARFERRLAIDQQAREAVATAVEIAQGVASGPVQPASTAPRSRRRRTLAWSAAAAAVCLAFALGWQVGDSVDEPASIPAVPLAPQVVESIPIDPAGDPLFASRLISLWSQAASEENDSSSSSAHAPEAAGQELLAVASPELVAEGSFETALDVPDWMWAAVMADMPAGSEQPADWEDN